jgi:hypothetical protein
VFLAHVDLRSGAKNPTHSSLLTHSNDEEPDYDEEEEEDLVRHAIKASASTPTEKDDMKRALAESRKCGKAWFHLRKS